VIGRVVVVGLGPAGPDLVTDAARTAIAAHPVRFLRTARHPAAEVVAGAESFDHVYEQEPTLDAVYARIVDEVIDRAGEHATVVYAVPGSPVVAERTVELLVADHRVEVELVPALSFLDLAWVRLGVDPVATGVRIVDGQRFAVEAAGERGPLLVAQCDDRLVLGDVKLVLDEGIDPSLGPDATVTVLHHLGLPDEEVRTIAWTDLDRLVEPDHLTSIWIPSLAAPVAREVQRFAEQVAVLRRECPWDREQTHGSLTRHLLEEAYELLDAIDALDPETGAGYDHLEEELGDLLFQVLFHATLAAEAGRFTLADVARRVHDKLELRHPHVFGAVEVEGAEDVVRNWEAIKQAEKGRESVFEGIPAHLPALLYALKVQKKAASLVDRGVVVPRPADLDDAVARVVAAPGDDAVGAVLLAVVDLARRAGIDPEAALRAVATQVRDDARRSEQGADG
jgi:tetrapyrrole methylase family protein / MazG family protein